MPFVEYILLAFLSSTAAAPGATSATATLRTLTADTVAQPAGGEMSSSVANTNSTGKKGHKGGKKGHKGGRKHKKGSGTTTPPPK